MKAQLTATGTSVQQKTRCIGTQKLFNPVSVHWLSVLNCLEKKMKALLTAYRQLGVTQHAMHDYTSALQSHQPALAIRIKVFGEELLKHC